MIRSAGRAAATSRAFRAFLKVTTPVKLMCQPSRTSSLENSRTMAMLSWWASRSWTMTGRFSSSARASWARNTACCRSRGGLSFQ